MPAWYVVTNLPTNSAQANTPRYRKIYAHADLAALNVLRKECPDVIVFIATTRKEARGIANGTIAGGLPILEAQETTPLLKGYIGPPRLQAQEIVESPEEIQKLSETVLMAPAADALQADTRFMQERYGLTREQVATLDTIISNVDSLTNADRLTLNTHGRGRLAGIQYLRATVTIHPADESYPALGYNTGALVNDTVLGLRELKNRVELRMSLLDAAHSEYRPYAHKSQRNEDERKEEGGE